MGEVQKKNGTIEAVYYIEIVNTTREVPNRVAPINGVGRSI
jgi:hypothetical protein